MQRVPSSPCEISKLQLCLLDQLSCNQLGRRFLVCVQAYVPLLAVDEELLALDTILLEESLEELSDSKLSSMLSECMPCVDVVQATGKNGILEGVVLLKVFTRSARS